MTIIRKMLMLMTFAGLLWAPGLAFAEDSTAPTQNMPLQRTIGGSTAAKTEGEPPMIVISVTRPRVLLVTGISMDGV